MSDTITHEALLNAAKILAGIPYVMTHKLATLPVSQQLYDAAPPEWKPLLFVMEYMPEPTPVERGALIRFQDRKGRK